MIFSLHCKKRTSGYGAILEKRNSCPVFLGGTEQELIEKAVAWANGEETQYKYINSRVLQYDYDPEALPDSYIEIVIDNFQPPLTMPQYVPCWLLEVDEENRKIKEKSILSGECSEGPTGHYHYGPNHKQRRDGWLAKLRKS